MGKYTLGVDVGGTNTRMAAAGADFKVLGQRAVRTKELSDTGDTVGALLRVMENFISDMGGEAAAVSLGLPSTLDRARTAVFSSPNVIGLDDVPIVRHFEDLLRVPVFIEKDACMLAFYDIHSRGIPRDGLIIGIYIGTGIGNVILLDGAPLVGKNGVSCELGHIPSLDKIRPCTCGNLGCMEEYVGGKALVRLCEREFPGTKIEDVFTEHGDDDRVVKFVGDMAFPVATEVNILDPDCIIIGGGVVAMENFPRKILEARVIELSRKPYPASNLNLVYSENAVFGGAVGAAIFAAEMLRRRG
jgi:allose kinase